MSLETAPARNARNPQGHPDASDNTAHKQNTPHSDLNLTNVFSDRVNNHNTGSEQSLGEQVRSTVNRFSEVLKNMQGASSAADGFGRDGFGIDDRSSATQKPTPAGKFAPESATDGKGVKNLTNHDGTQSQFNPDDSSAQHHTGELAEKPAAGKQKKKFAQLGVDTPIPIHGEDAPVATLHAKSEVPAPPPVAALHAKSEIPASASVAALHAKSEIPAPASVAALHAKSEIPAPASVAALHAKSEIPAPASVAALHAKSEIPAPASAETLHAKSAAPAPTPAEALHAKSAAPTPAPAEALHAKSAAPPPAPAEALHAKPATPPPAPAEALHAKPAAPPPAPAEALHAKPATPPPAPAEALHAKPATPPPAPAEALHAKPATPPPAPAEALHAKPAAPPPAPAEALHAKPAAPPPAPAEALHAKPAAPVVPGSLAKSDAAHPPSLDHGGTQVLAKSDAAHPQSLDHGGTQVLAKSDAAHPPSLDHGGTQVLAKSDAAHPQSLDHGGTQVLAKSDAAHPPSLDHGGTQVLAKSDAAHPQSLDHVGTQVLAKSDAAHPQSLDHGGTQVLAKSDAAHPQSLDHGGTQVLAKSDAAHPQSLDHGGAQVLAKSDAVHPPSLDHGGAQVLAKSDAVHPPSLDHGGAQVLAKSDAAQIPTSTERGSLLAKSEKAQTSTSEKTTQIARVEGAQAQIQASEKAAQVARVEAAQVQAQVSGKEAPVAVRIEAAPARSSGKEASVVAKVEIAQTPPRRETTDTVKPDIPTIVTNSTSTGFGGGSAGPTTNASPASQGQGSQSSTLTVQSQQGSQNLGPAMHDPRGSQNLGPAMQDPQGSQNSGPVMHDSQGSQNLGPVMHDPQGSQNLGLVMHDPQGSQNLGPVMHDPRGSQNLGPAMQDPQGSQNLGPVLQDPRGPQNLGSVMQDPRGSQNSNPVMHDPQELQNAGQAGQGSQGPGSHGLPILPGPSETTDGIANGSNAHLPQTQSTVMIQNNSTASQSAVENTKFPWHMDYNPLQTTNAGNEPSTHVAAMRTIAGVFDSATTITPNVAPMHPTMVHIPLDGMQQVLNDNRGANFNPIHGVIDPGIPADLSSNKNQPAVMQQDPTSIVISPAQVDFSIQPIQEIPIQFELDQKVLHEHHQNQIGHEHGHHVALHAQDIEHNQAHYGEQHEHWQHSHTNHDDSNIEMTPHSNRVETAEQLDNTFSTSFTNTDQSEISQLISNSYDEQIRMVAEDILKGWNELQDYRDKLDQSRRTEEERNNNYQQMLADRKETAEQLDIEYRSREEILRSARNEERLRQEESDRRRKQEEEDKRRKQEENIRRLSDTMLTAMTTKRQQELDEKAQADQLRQHQQRREKQLREDTKQEKYIVRPNDTLESITKKKLGALDLLTLLYELNKSKIQVKYAENGEPLYVVKVGTILFLPSRKQIREYRQRLLSQSSNNHSMPLKPGSPESQINQNRRANIEKFLGPISSVKTPNELHYTIRLGDSLRSIALKHPALKDVALWKLVARKNGLPTTTDSKGAPTAALNRGSTMVIPTQTEIAEYRLTVTGNNLASMHSKSAQGVQNELAATPCPSCLRLVTASSFVCPACACQIEKGEAEEVDDKTRSRTFTDCRHEFETGNLVSFGKVIGDTTLSFKRPLPNGVQSVPTEEEIIDSTTEQLSDTCRIIKSVLKRNVAEITQSHLEILHGSEWLAVLAYEVSDTGMVRHEFLSNGTKRSVMIDLPSCAAQEMIQNDLASNWLTYCKKFLSAKRLSA